MNDKKSNTVNLTIEKLGGEGVGIARLSGKTIFVPYGVPEDVISAEIIQDKKSFSKARIIEVLKRSQFRVPPPCKYFGSCGGCSYQNIKYEYQLKFKQDLIAEIFRNFLNEKLNVQPVERSGAEYGYRNKMMIHCFSFDGRKLNAGFHKFNTHELINIDSCPLHSKGINDLLKTTVTLLNDYKISAYNPKIRRGFIKDIVIRESFSSGDLLLTLVINEKELKYDDKMSKILFKKYDKLKGFFTYHNPHETDYVFKDSEKIMHNSHNSPLQKIYGDIITDKISKTRFKISPVSFFQVNTVQAENMASYIGNIIRNDSAKNFSVIDAYAGIGTLSMPLAENVKSVYAIEFVNNLAVLGKDNAKLNGLNNYFSYTQDAPREIKRLLKKMDIDKFRAEYRYIILDPPRAGLSDEMIDLLCILRLKKMIYVSCNPIVQARDIEKFTSRCKYKINSIKPFDMFPQTFHVENVVELELFKD